MPVNGEVQPIDAERAIKVMANDIGPAAEKNASARGDLSAAWKIVEDECGCNKGGAKLYLKLSRMSDELRDDFLRTLYTLMKVGGIGISRDLVDAMHDSDAPTMPTVDKSGGMGAESLATTH
jgi:hypothetical protein